ncbi:hypothetical protein KKC_03164 [Listeria fleischmannii subsp. coloradonensis]|nr:hypothetical protein KKC_03164 [Listeria fleischmannii subsp. coloradonensis]
MIVAQTFSVGFFLPFARLVFLDIKYFQKSSPFRILYHFQSLQTPYFSSVCVNTTKKNKDE